MEAHSSLTIEVSQVKALISAHDGVVSQLFIWSLINQTRDCEKAARELCLTLQDITSGFEKLDRLFSNTTHSQAEVVNTSVEEQRKLLSPKEELPTYEAYELSSCLEKDEFKAIIAEAQVLFGRGLSSPEMTKLYGMYDYLKLPADVIFMLLNYCFEETENNKGSGKKPTIRYIEREAFFWANNNINTFEAADAFIKRRKDCKSVSSRIFDLLGIKNREPGKSEISLINKWIDWGFDYDCVYEAYDRTVLKIHEPNLKYIDSIITGWHEKGLKNIDLINSEAPRLYTQAKAAVGKAKDSDDFEAAKRFLNKARREANNQ